MKNIHVLPTNKPSRLGQVYEKLSFFKDRTWNNTENWRCKNIYITNDEEIKEGDYVGYTTLKNWVPVKYLGGDLTGGEKKIILTTDQDLIADGVQAIDDEFLEWFVKNPSCEEIEVNHFGMCCSNQLIAQCINCNQYNPVYKIIIPKEELKQETLEEAAERLFPFTKDDSENRIITIKRLFWIEGVKWQQERMYSEEEVFNLCREFAIFVQRNGPSYKKQQQWFEQFKKK